MRGDHTCVHVGSAGLPCPPEVLNSKTMHAAIQGIRGATAPRPKPTPAELLAQTRETIRHYEAVLAKFATSRFSDGRIREMLADSKRLEAELAAAVAVAPTPAAS